MILALSALLLLGAGATPVQAMCKAPEYVSGVWKSNDGGTFHVKVIGDSIWWVGMSGDGGKTWTNVFKGTRSGDIIEGAWADVRGKAGGHGTLKLRISGTKFMEKLGGTGSGFGGKRWDRGGCEDTRSIPVRD